MMINNHPFLSMSNHINDICKPLFQFGIHLFSYRRTFINGSRINLSNNANWLEDYFNLDLYKSSLFEGKIDGYFSRFSVWPQESALPIFAHGREYYHSDNGLTFILNNKNFCDYFIFGADKNNKSMINFFINNLDLIKNFTEYFYDHSHDLLINASKNLIILPCVPENKSNMETTHKTLDSYSIKELFPIKFSRDKSTPQLFNLSPREMMCIKFLLEGKTAKEIAKQLNLSYRTIEYYFENIRNKTSCRNKYELIAFFHERKNNFVKTNN